MPPWLLPLGITALGGLFGSHQRRPLSPELLARFFGPGALSDETNKLYRMLQASPSFQQIMQQGAIRGSQIGGQVRANLARRGVGSSPLAGFQSAASRGYGGAIQSRAQGQLFNEALQAAIQNLANRQQSFVSSYLQGQRMPTFGQQFGSSLAGAGGTMFADLLSKSKAPGSFTEEDLAKALGVSQGLGQMGTIRLPGF